MKESPEGHGMNGESVIMTGKNHVNTNIENKVTKLCKVLFRDGCMYYKATGKKKWSTQNQDGGYLGGSRIR